MGKSKKSELPEGSTVDPKSYAQAVGAIKTRASTLRASGMEFCCMVVDLVEAAENGEGSHCFPESHHVINALEVILSTSLKPREIPEKVMEKLKALGKLPAPGPSAMLLMIVAVSQTCVHLTFNLPDSMGLDADTLLTPFQSKVHTKTPYNVALSR